MKRRWGALALTVCMLLSSLALFGCEAPEPGPAGKSAYELACEAGFEGTLEEWLASLKGDAGERGEAGPQGATGEPGEPGEDGEDGRDGSEHHTTVIVGGEQDPLGVHRYAAAMAVRSTVSVFSDAGAGSGVIYSLDKDTGDAYIITNYHVLYDEDAADRIGQSIEVFLYGAEYSDCAIPARYIGGSMYYDIAVLEVRGCDRLRGAFPAAATLGPTDTAMLGQAAIAVGNASGDGLAVTSGVVSVPSEQVEITAPDGITKVVHRVMRIDTPVNPGNSGGGLFDGQGRLIGIVSAKLVETKVENVGYAIPVDLAVAVAENILDTCNGVTVKTMQRAFLGVTVELADPHAVWDPETGLVSIHEGVCIKEVADGVALGLLEVGDRILAVQVDGRDVLTLQLQHQMPDELLYARIGSTVTLTVLRGGEELTVSVPITAAAVRSY